MQYVPTNTMAGKRENVGSCPSVDGNSASTAWLTFFFAVVKETRCFSGHLAQRGGCTFRWVEHREVRQVGMQHRQTVIGRWAHLLLQALDVALRDDVSVGCPNLVQVSVLALPLLCSRLLLPYSLQVELTRPS